MSSNEPQKPFGTLGIILIILASGWMIALSAVTQFIAGIGVILASTQLFWVGASLAQAVGVGLMLLPLALLWQTGRQRGVLSAWGLALGYLLLMVPTRYFAPIHIQLATLAQCLVSFGYWVALSLLARPSQRPTYRGIALSLSLLALLAYSWLAWGALGSPLDSLLNAMLGLLVGLIATGIIGHFWLPQAYTEADKIGGDIALGGLVVGSTLLLIGSAVGLHGVQLLLMLTLPALGWLLMAMAAYRPNEHRFDLVLLIGGVTALPLLLIDVDGMSFQLLGQQEILAWAFLAALISVGLSWLVGLFGAIFNQPLRQWQPASYLSGLVALGFWLIALLIYLFMGQPGLYGDKLFIVLNSQADLSAATDIQDYDERRQFVYQKLVEHANRHQADLRATFDRLGIVYTPYYLVNGLAVEGGLVHRLLLSFHPDVDRVMPSTVMRPLPVPLQTATGSMMPPTEPEWNLTNIQADRVWHEFGVRGAGITVGQSDSGVQWTHPELQDSYRGEDNQHDYHWFDPWNGTATPHDVGGHGTHTLGSIVGNRVGIAPDATWYGCANLDRSWGSPALYLDCMQFMLAPFPLKGDPFRDGDPTQSAHVLNNSWGCPEAEEGCDIASLRPAVQALRAAGIFVVTSAGNEGPRCETINDPISIYDAVLSVGAVDEDNRISRFSSRGPVTIDGSGRIKPDIVAPGVDVLSAYPNDSYELASGTSMAGPHIVGVIALMWSANPNLIGNIDQTEQILLQTATRYTATTDIQIDSACSDISTQPNNVAGYGIVDAYAAVQQALQFTE